MVDTDAAPLKDRHGLSSGKMAALLIVAAVLLMGGYRMTVGGLGWSDAPNHTFDGIFVLDFLKTLPIDDPMGYAREFYLRYPALGMLVYYPPGFALVESAIFALMGVNIFAARFTILLFAFGAGWLMFKLGRRWFDDDTGLFAALLLITCPHGVLWLNDVMLEWPATFWILATVYCYDRDLNAPDSKWVWWFGIAATMAFLTKQTAGFVLGVTLLHAIIQPDRRVYFLRRNFLASLGVTAVVIAGYHLVARRYAALPAQLLTPSLDARYYAVHLAEIVGRPLLPIVLLGLITLLASLGKRPNLLLVLWLSTWTVFSAAITAKEPRYFFFALPPLMFATVRFLLPYRNGQRNQISFRNSPPRSALLIAIALTQGAIAHVWSPGRLPDFAAAARILESRPDADIVLVDGVRDGQFIFDLYQTLQQRETPAARSSSWPTRTIIPLRASKVLYARPARAQWGYEAFVHSQDDIVSILDRYGIRYVVLESRPPTSNDSSIDPPPRQWLRQLMTTDPRFHRIASWPIGGDDPDWQGVELLLYEYPVCPPRQSDTITLSIPAMGDNLSFKLPGTPAGDSHSLHD